MKSIHISNSVLNSIIGISLIILAYLLISNHAAPSSPSAPIVQERPTTTPTPGVDQDLQSCTHWLFDLPDGSIWTYSLKVLATPAQNTLQTPTTTFKLTKLESSTNTILFSYQEGQKKASQVHLRCGQYGLVGDLSFTLMRGDLTLFPYASSPQTFVTHSQGHLAGIGLGLDTFTFTSSYNLSNEAADTIKINGKSNLEDSVSGPTVVFSEEIEQGKGITHFNFDLTMGEGNTIAQIETKLLKFVAGPKLAPSSSSQ